MPNVQRLVNSCLIPIKAKKKKKNQINFARCFMLNLTFSKNFQQTFKVKKIDLRQNYRRTREKVSKKKLHDDFEPLAAAVATATAEENLIKCNRHKFK